MTPSDREPAHERLTANSVKDRKIVAAAPNRRSHLGARSKQCHRDGAPRRPSSRRHSERAERGVELVGAKLGAGAGRVLRGDLEVPCRGPLRHDAEDLVEVLLRIEAVESARGDEAEG
jgi:hypothetical protein